MIILSQHRILQGFSSLSLEHQLSCRMEMPSQRITGLMGHLLHVSLCALSCQCKCLVQINCIGMKVQYLSWLTIKIYETKNGARQALCFLPKLLFLHPLICFCLLFFFFFIDYCLLHPLYPTKLISPTNFVSSIHLPH